MKVASVSFLLLLLVALAPACEAVYYSYTVPKLPGESFTKSHFRLWIPDNLGASDKIRGVGFFLNGQDADTRFNLIEDANEQAVCEEEKCVLLGARLNENYMSSGIGDAVLRALAWFAQESGHAELEHSAIFFNGFSWGGQFSYHFTRWKPQRVIGFITQKGGFHDTSSASFAAIRVPGFWFIGEFDQQFRKDNINRIFNDHRPRGARWALGVDQAGHKRVNTADRRDLLRPYFRTVMNLRLPSTIPTNQPPSLKVISESDGWLGNPNNSYIGHFDCYGANENKASWLPSRGDAENWQDFESDGTVTNVYSCPGGLPPTDAPTHAPTNQPTNPPTNAPTDLPTDPPVDPPSGEGNVRLVVNYDNAPVETFWKLFHFPGDGQQIVVAERQSGTTDGTTYDEEFQLAPGNYEFRITDEADNGICCSNGNGFYRIYVNGDIVAEGGEFQTRRVKEPFTISGPVDPPSGEGNVRLVVDYDNAPHETSWKIFHFPGGGQQILIEERQSGITDGTTYDQELQLDPGYYEFRISDEAENGICCSNGNGSYLINVDGVVVASGGEFQMRRVKEPFTVG